MPIIDALGYPVVEDVMLLARSIVNDTWPGLTNTPGEGQILTNDPAVSPFTLPFIKSATRSLYRALGNTGTPTFKKEVVLTGITPVSGPQGVGVPDPAVQVNLGYLGYFDGTNTNPNLTLPTDVLTMERMWERATGSNAPFQPMDQSQFGLPSRNQTDCLGVWESRTDAVWMCGSIQDRDLRLRYDAALPLVGPNSDFTSTSIPILDSTDALAYMIASMYGIARGAAQAPLLDAKAQEEIRQMKNRQVRARQAVNYSRPPYGDEGGGSSPYGQ